MRLPLSAFVLLFLPATSFELGAQTRGNASDEWWRTADTGPFISDTFYATEGGQVAALKGIAIKLGEARDASVLFDTELLCWRAGFDGTVVLKGSAWSGRNEESSSLPNGENQWFFENLAGLGFAIDGNDTDPRDPKAGPLPHSLGRYRGLFRHGQQVVVHYTIGGVNVFELPSLETIAGVRAVSRTIHVDASPSAALALLVRTLPPSGNATSEKSARLKPGSEVYLIGAPRGVALRTHPDGRTVVTIDRGTPASRFKIAYTERPLKPSLIPPAIDLATLRQGGPALFPQTFTVEGKLDASAAKKPYAVDLVPLPAENPWGMPVRLGGFDFFPDGRRIAASTWNGDVWIADGIDGDMSKVTWRRFASGLFQTLGLRIVDGVIHTQGRDQITRLHDRNGDGEADHYECFNNDVMITSGFHEFTFDLETDRDGNFYFSKAMPVLGGGRGFGPTTPHNGTVLKVSRDGSRLDVVAWGLRAPGGVGVSPEGIVTTGENEGSFVPACKISWTRPGQVTFNGVVPSKWNKRDFIATLPGAPTDYDRPLCWLPYYVDNSSGSQVWVPEQTAWDPRHAGEMLHLSYGKSSIYRALREEVNGQAQGGVYRLPIEINAAVMRARFHPHNGQLYVLGFRGWQTNGRDAFQRVRFTGVSTPLPVGLHARRNGLIVRFSEPLDPRTAEDPARYSLSKWNYVWGPQYGSGRFSIDQRDAAAEEKALVVPSKGAHNLIDSVAIGAAKLVEDGRAVFLYVPKMTPAMQMELKLDVTDTQGRPVRETIYHTVHATSSEFHLPGVRWEDIRVAESEPAGEPGLALSFDGPITDTRPVSQLALTVPAGTAPSVFLGPGEFLAVFQGTLIIPDRDDYTFSLEGRGTVSLQIDGKVIASGELPLVASVPLSLNKGSHAIYCSYHSTPSGERRVRLMWGTPRIRTEPVPASAFRHFPNATMELWAKARRGRDLFADAQCIRCHQPRGGTTRRTIPELLATVPDFNNIGNRLNSAWLQNWIVNPEGHCPSLATAQAPDVAAYLETQKDPAWLPPPSIPSDSASVAAGAELVDKLKLGFWIEPLIRSRRHTDGGLIEALRFPAKHHRDTVFPDVRLSLEEATRIAAYIRSRQPAPQPALAGRNPLAGQVVVAASCVSCHAPSENAPKSLALDDIAKRDWSVRGCVSINRGGAPDLRLSPEQVTQLLDFRNADREMGIRSLNLFSPVEYATRQLAVLNCAQCHAGDNKLPDLTYAGEKLDYAWLVALLEGRHSAKTRPWLEARMPAFPSRAANLVLGLASQHGVSPAGDRPKPGTELAAIGAKIVGTEGYSCIACHDAGSKKALQVFEGQGPNLALSPQRLRHDYFQRWMHFPQRVQPTTIMPRYTLDRDRALLDTVFESNAEKQFEAVWQWMCTLQAK